jgi:predicted permease
MTPLRRSGMWLRALLRRAGLESELDREMRLHVEMETAENIRRGMTPDEAARRARVAFGGMELTREAVRDERGTQWLDHLISDVRYAVRGAVARPGFTAAVIVLIALGTGANAAIFSVVDRLVLHPIPFRDGERMVEMTATSVNGAFFLTPSTTLIDAWRARARLIEDFQQSQGGGGVLGDTARIDAKPLNGSAIGPGMFAFVGMRPVRGREILAADTVPGAAPVVILGYALWKREFGGADDVVGRTVLLDGKPVAVIGVAPRGFGVPFSASGELFTALHGGSSGYARDPIAKLKPGVTREAAQRELAQIASTLESQKGAGEPKLMTHEDLNAGGTRRVVLLLFGAVAFVLLIACANVANLLLARAWSRQREFALRAALGASRGRLLRQVFTESLGLALLGGAAGLFVAMAFLKIVIAVQPNVSQLADIPTDVWLDRPVLLWTLGVSLLTGLLFGMAPAFLASERKADEVLKSSARTTGSGVARRVRSGLVVIEVALSVVLLVGAGLLVRTLAAMQRADLGFEPHGISAIALQLRQQRFPDSTKRRDALASVIDAVKTRPGVTAVSYALTVPSQWVLGMGGIEIEGIPTTAGDSLGLYEMNVVAPEYFSTVGLRLVRGRVFAPNTRLTDQLGSNEVMINERLANRFWPKGDAIGAKIKRRDDWATVVGVVRDVDLPSGKSLARASVQLYYALPAAPQSVALIVRSPLLPPEVKALLRAAVKAAGPGVRIGGFTTADAEVAHSQSVLKFTLTLLGIFALLAVVLAAVGLNAVIAYSVSQRTREIGIRMALGAEARAVARLVIGEGVVLGVVGTVVGCAVAVMATGLLRTLLFGVKPGDPWTMGAVGVGLLAVSVLASAIPAWRAARINPVEMIRSE